MTRVVGDAEQLGDLALAVVHEVDRRPRRAEATLAQGEHEAPHGRQQRAPCARAHHHRGVVEAAPQARDQHHRGAVEVVRQVAGGVPDLRLALTAAVTGRRTRRRASTGTRRSWRRRRRRPPCCLSASSTTTQCQPWRFDPVGACKAISRHSSTVARSTGRSKSRRLRTERVVVSTSSAVRFSFIAPSVAGDDRAMSDRVTISVDASGVADVRLNRPDKRNALDGAMFAGLRDAGERLKSEPGVPRRRALGRGRVVLRRSRLRLVPVDGRR